jgi:hypothetical protein
MMGQGPLLPEHIRSRMPGNSFARDLGDHAGGREVPPTIRTAASGVIAR